MKKTILIATIIASTFVLQGCLAAVVGVGVGATAKVVSDPRTIGTQIDDNTLDVKVSAKIKEDSNSFAGARIVVASYNTDILLLGQAKSAAQIAKAEQIAKSIEGVGKVYNQIRIAPQITAGALAKDAVITAQIKSKLVFDKATKARDIKVITEDGQVFLMGIVTPEDGKVAAEIASKVDGVTLVVTMFNYN